MNLVIGYKIEARDVLFIYNSIQASDVLFTGNSTKSHDAMAIANRLTHIETRKSSILILLKRFDIDLTF